MSGVRSGWVGCAAFLGLALLLGLRAAPPAERQRPAPLDCTGKNGVSAAEVRRAQEEWAKFLGRKVEETIEIADSVTMTFVLVPPGKFHMGSPTQEQAYLVKTLFDGKRPGWLNNELQHGVVLTEPFDLGKTEVTQAQYEGLGLDNPSQFKGADRPVEHVSWTEARDWAAKFTAKREDQHLYRLPTEAEWEYSCRGGRSGSQPFGVGNGGRALSSRQANINGNEPYGDAPGLYLEATCAVGSFPANSLGLHDMHGNVGEWCQDGFGPYPRGTVTNPTNPEKGTNRVYRGGSWDDVGWFCRAAYRFHFAPGGRLHTLGFRLARTIPSAVR